MKKVTNSTRFADICKRAEIVFRNPDDFQFDRFETEEVAIFDRTVLRPDLIYVTYILWGILPNGNRGKCLQFTKEESAVEYERRNGVCPLK
jgi:hypothetical protein